jgi:hypothetical protein
MKICFVLLFFFLGVHLAFDCEKRIFDEKKFISEKNLKFLCQKIEKNDLFLIILKENISDNLNPYPESYYEKETGNIFNEKCGTISQDLCKKGLGIFIYEVARKGFIVTGSSVSSTMYYDQKKKIQSEIQYFISDRAYYESINVGIDSFKQETKKISPSSDTVLYLLLISIGLILIVIVVYYLLKRKKRYVISQHATLNPNTTTIASNS